MVASAGTSAAADGDNSHINNAPSPVAATKPGRLKRIWHKLGLDVATMQQMLKVSLPPTIAVAMYQSSVVANHFLTDGYFIALLSFAMLPILPRVRYIRVVLFTAILLCVYCCLSLFAVWTALQARRHTTKPGDDSVYNSSQAVVLAVWLFVFTFASNSARDVFRQDQIAFVLSGILEIAILTSGVNFRTMDQAIDTSLRLLESFLLGMGLSTVVSLFIFPLTCRDVMFKFISGYLQGLENVLKAQNGYMRSLEHEDPWFSASASTITWEHGQHDRALASLYVIASKVRAEQRNAQREIAFAKLPASELGPLVDCAMRIMPALSGLGFIFQILAEVPKDKGYVEGAEDEKRAVQQLQAMMQVICEPCEKLSHAMSQGIEHVRIILELKKPSEPGRGHAEIKPGTPEFATWYDERTADFEKLNEVLARVWYRCNGVELPRQFSDADLNSPAWEEVNERLGQQVRPFTIIYIVYLIFAASRELSELIAFVDNKAREGVFKQRHLTLPTFKHLQQCFGWTRKADSPPTSSAARTGSSGMFRQRQSNQHFDGHRDPEHLAATSWYETAGNLVRQIPRFLRSNHATHGLRVACAIMSIAVGFYVKTSSKWFSTNRWLWAMLAIQLSMGTTAGLSFFLFLCRIGGTIVAMIAAFIIYYIVDGRTAGVIVFLWIYFLVAGYILLKHPLYTSAVIVSVFASIVMVANELQDKKLGFGRVEALGQNAHEEYIIAPTRLGIVSAGVAIAYFWTIFPYPISEHSALRRKLADTLFSLASYHSMVASTVSLRARGTESFTTRNQNELAKRRLKQFTKLQFQFAQLKQHLMYTNWQIILGGKFPKKEYAELVRLCEQVCNASSVIGYASSSFMRAMEEARDSGKGPSKWLAEFQQLLESVKGVFHEVTGALLMLSNHLANGTPFPPYLAALESSSVAEKVEELNSELMGVSHILEPAYTGFVTMLLAGKATRRAVARQLEICKELVGVLDFSSLIDMERQPLMMDELETGGGLP